ncbi:Ni/Co efflux regulator RcnB [Pseudomonas sp. JUb42]|jgi:Ni/Co efflux regulator RcnB|uniref:RcnB family protein n=1 Tax=Pseudomonas sp. JUb42 TaxID=2940611 RepID=UPI002169B3E2|nr:RcnB family protein [Pseudomonas sp. JUb42]MCS3467736.1 Ni/Co efflux regulator RcnB [Pseudomonas sp. JUb42]
MKLPNRLLAGLGVLMISISPLTHADDHDQGRGRDDNHGQQHGPGPQGNGHGNDHGNNRGGNRPPDNFDDVRHTFQEHRDVIGRGQPLPPNIHIVKGHPLPRGYGKRLDQRSLQYLPRYDGYEWRRTGTDVVLVAIGTGIVYEILQGVLN